MHPEADALLDAIFAEPDDDTPRLVYADWLEEYGQTDYAAFIRLSVKVDRDAKSLAERQQLREARYPLWQQITTSRQDAFRSLPLTIHKFHRGICRRVVATATDFLRTVPTWWPVITPAELVIYAAVGQELGVVEAASRYCPRLTFFQCDNRLAEEDHDEYLFPSLAGHIVGDVADGGRFPKLQSLDIHIAHAEPVSLQSFAESELARRLETVYLEVQLPEPNQYKVICVQNKMRPDAISLAVGAVLNEVRRHPNFR